MTGASLFIGTPHVALVVTAATELNHRSTLFSPFFPFIAVFGNVIAQRDLEDMALLEAFVLTLESAAEISPAVQKLQQVCSNFHQIAKICVARHAQQTTPSNNTTEDIDADSQSSIRALGTDLQSLPQFFLPQQDWDLILNEWDLAGL